MNAIQPQWNGGGDRPLVLLFYDGFERVARPGIGGRLYSGSRRFARYAYRTLKRAQVHTGFYTAFLSLAASLRLIGCEVRINDFATARAHPGHPIGLCGYPSVLRAVDLPNPVIFGHGDLGLPEIARQVAAEDRMRILIQPCDWACDFNRPYCGDKLRAWPVGVDHTRWDLPDIEKTCDFLVYDKIRWHRDTLVASVRDAILAKLEAAGHTVTVLQYGKHIREDYRRALAQSRALLFLCEHETQGIAYQEAMAAGLPVLAWDEGRLVDPELRPYAPGLEVTSVPYFDARCGMRFTLDTFDRVLPEFVANRPAYRPRDYMIDRLSMRRAGIDYLALYQSMMAH